MISIRKYVLYYRIMSKFGDLVNFVLLNLDLLYEHLSLLFSIQPTQKKIYWISELDWKAKFAMY